MSIAHVNEAFNQGVQADYMIVYIYAVKFQVLNIIVVGNQYPECSISPALDASSMTELPENICIYNHGALRGFSTDTEICRTIIDRLPNKHIIELEQRSSRSSHKSGGVERNNGVFNKAIKKLVKADPESSASLLIARAPFLHQSLSWI